MRRIVKRSLPTQYLITVLGSLMVILPILIVLFGNNLRLHDLHISNTKPTATTATSTSTHPEWTALLSQVAPSCQSPKGTVWSTPPLGTSLSCDKSGLIMQQNSAKYYGEVDLDKINDITFSEMTFRVQVQTQFKTPGDTKTFSALTIQNVSNDLSSGYIFMVNYTGLWELEDIVSPSEIHVLEEGIINIPTSQKITLTLSVINNVLYGSINSQEVLSYSGNSTLQTNIVGLMVINAEGASSPVNYSNFELDYAQTSITAPKPGSILYQIAQSRGWSGWNGTASWKILNGILINDGTSTSGQGPTVIAPYEPTVSDYAVEAKVRIVQVSSSEMDEFGILVRGVSTSNGWGGYIAGISSAGIGQTKAGISLSPNNVKFGSKPFNPSNVWHTYRVQVKGNHVSFLVDGQIILSVIDNIYLSSGQIGFQDNGYQIEISSFRVVAL